MARRALLVVVAIAAVGERHNHLLWKVCFCVRTYGPLMPCQLTALTAVL